MCRTINVYHSQTAQKSQSEKRVKVSSSKSKLGGKSLYKAKVIQLHETRFKAGTFLPKNSSQRISPKQFLPKNSFHKIPSEKVPPKKFLPKYSSKNILPKILPKTPQKLQKKLLKFSSNFSKKKILRFLKYPIPTSQLWSENPLGLCLL